MPARPKAACTRLRWLSACGEVAGHALVPRVELLRQQPDVVDQAHQPVEQREGVVGAAGGGVRRDQPEGARHERVFVATHSVHPGLGPVTQQQAIAQEVVLDRFDGPQHPRIVAVDEADVPQHQQGRVDLGGVVLLGEAVAPLVEAARQDLLADRFPLRTPVVDGPVSAVLLDGPHGAVEGGPGHRLGVGEVLPRTPDLPEAMVRFAPGSGRGYPPARAGAPRRCRRAPLLRGAPCAARSSLHRARRSAAAARHRCRS